MWFRSLFDTLLARTSRTRLRKTRPAPSFRRRCRSFRPLLEIPEDRTLLSNYVVNSLTDTGTGSGLTGDLRYCTSHATSGNDTITFQQGLTGTIDLESALPLNTSVAIQGPGAVALTVWRDPDSSSSFAVFAVGSTATVEISGLTIIDTNQTNESAIANSGTLTVSTCNLYGNSATAVANSGTLTVSDCDLHTLNPGCAITNSGTATVSDCDLSGGLMLGVGVGVPGAIDNTGTMTIGNTAFEGFFTSAAVIANSGVLTVNSSTLSGNSGRAIFNQGALTINNSTLNNNEAVGSANRSGTTVIGYNGMGGGIFMSAGTLSINSSTLQDNTAIGGGGGTPQGSGYGTATGGQGGNGLGGALYIAGGTVSIDNSTLADNQANGGSVYNGSIGAGYGGGIYNAAGPGALRMYDTILADNSATTAASDLDGSLTSLGHNLIGNSTGGSGFAASDLLNVNPQLGNLQNNGGPTLTMALLAGSPAINAGDNTNAPAYDQRGPGFARIVGGTIDIGAFEVQTTNQPSSFSLSGIPPQRHRRQRPHLHRHRPQCQRLHRHQLHRHRAVQQQRSQGHAAGRLHLHRRRCRRA